MYLIQKSFLLDIMIQIKQTSYKKPLLVFALEKEAGEEFKQLKTVFIGLGKVNATYNLIKALEHHQPDIIINLGTAGSTKFNRGEVVCCTRFIQRDMEVSALGYQKFETPFDSTSIILDNGLLIDGLPIGICGTGDQFETEHKNPEYNVIDMEAYALAKVAKLENIPFLCLKYISDGADDSAVEDWTQEVKKASVALKAALEKVLV